MFDQPPSLPLRAAIASILGSLFGIAMILASHGAHAQTHETAAAPQPTAAADTSPAMQRLGDVVLRSLSSLEPTLDSGVPGSRGLRMHDSGSEAGSGLRWHVAPRRVLRSEVENPRGNDRIGLGLHVSF